MENSAELKDLVALLHVELARLPKMYREPFILCHLKGNSRAETAKLMGYAIATLDRYLRRAEAILKRRIQRATGCDEAIAISSMLTANALVGRGPHATSRKLVEQTVSTALLGAGGLAVTGSVSANVLSLANWFVHENAHRALRFVLLIILGMAGAGLATGYSAKKMSIPVEPLRATSAPPAVSRSVEDERKPLKDLEKILREPVAAKVLGALEKIGGKATLREAWIDEHHIAHLVAGWDFPPFGRNGKVIVNYVIQRGEFNLRTTMWKEEWQEDYPVDIDRPIIYRGFGKEIVIQLPQISEMKAAFEVLRRS